MISTKTVWILTLAATAAMAAGVSLGQAIPTAQPPPPWMNKALSPQTRAELLVKEMTLEEKISQIHMLDVPSHPREVAGVPRLGIPVLRITNGPVGAGPGDSNPSPPATALPSALALAASWDTALAAEYGRIAGEEVADRGEHVIEAPGLNITRVPQCGRNFEYLGEDPYLTARMAVEEVKSIQAAGVIAMIKHFAANNQESYRKTVNEVIDERTLREIYLPAFETVVKEADPGAVMAAYPSVNGAFCSENSHLLKEVLRGEWGFKGFVQSDYTGTKSAAPAARAGLDLSMQAKDYAGGMRTALAANEVPESTVDEMVQRRFAIMFKFGMFDEPRQTKTIPAEQDGAVARKIATESAVLLKNDGILPLKAGAIKSIAVIGPYASAAHTGGSGSSAVRPLYTVKPVDGLQRVAGPGVTVTLSDGADVAAAADRAKAADIVLVMVGNRDREGGDRANLQLPNKQDALIEAVAAVNPRTIVVLKTGGPVLMPWLDRVPAVLEAWYPGEEDGNVVADLLFGVANPSGKLPMTFPRTEAEVPANTKAQWPGVGGNSKGVGITATYSEKLLVGYRWYDAQAVAPLYPFGFGLSYTTFTFANLKVSDPGPAGTTVEADVTNSGQRQGADVVQVYVSANLVNGKPAAGEPPKRLCGLTKLDLKPMETRHVTIKLDPRAYMFWDTVAGRWATEAGPREMSVGDSSRNLPLKATINVTAER